MGKASDREPEHRRENLGQGVQGSSGPRSALGLHHSAVSSTKYRSANRWLSPSPQHATAPDYARCFLSPSLNSGGFISGNPNSFSSHRTYFSCSSDGYGMTS